MKIFVAFAGSLLLGAPLATHAANADHPYSNIDPRNDAGNNTGDSQVDRLNQAQLNRNGGPARVPLPWGYARPQAYYQGPSVYAPRGYYAPPRNYYGW